MGVENCYRMFTTFSIIMCVELTLPLSALFAMHSEGELKLERVNQLVTINKCRIDTTTL
jgi:hypothetical protein